MIHHTPNWEDDALCAQVDGDTFFPGKGASANDPRSICAKCEVVAQCLAGALALPVDWDYGIRGGTTKKQRLKMRKDAA